MGVVSLVLRLTVAEALAGGCKLAQLVAHHFFRDCDWYMIFAIMNEELKSTRPKISTSLLADDQ